MGGLDLLPALGWCCLVSRCSAGGARVPAPAGEPSRPRPCSGSGPRGRACHPSPDRSDEGPNSVAPRDSAPPPAGHRVGRGPADGPRRSGGVPPLVTQAHRERELAQGTLGTADHDTRALWAGQSRVPHTYVDRSTGGVGRRPWSRTLPPRRSEEHTSELQSRQYLVCRLLLEKKKRAKV